MIYIYIYIYVIYIYIYIYIIYVPLFIYIYHYLGLLKPCKYLYNFTRRVFTQLRDYNQYGRFPMQFIW